MERKTINNIVKTGMTLSMLYLVWTGMGRGRANWEYHTVAGVSLIGFSLWHYNLYNPFVHKN